MIQARGDEANSGGAVGGRDMGGAGEGRLRAVRRVPEGQAEE